MVCVSHINVACAIVEHAVEIQFHAQWVDDCLEWGLIISHTCIIPPVKHENDVGPSNDIGPSNDAHRLHLV